MARSHNNFKPRRSRKSGLKSNKLVNQNNKIIKNLENQIKK